jgi:hypothetical protein
MPADDGSGATGPAGPRAYIYSSFENQVMPSDDSAGGGTPRSNAALTVNLASVAALYAVVLSRAQLM